MSKNDRIIAKQLEEKNRDKILNPLSIKSKNNKKDLSYQKCRLSINIILSLILIIILIYALATYNPQWRIFYFLASWSYLMNIYYILSVTIIDFFSIVFNKFFKFYNSFIRDYYIRICIPFGIAEVFIYWELVLMGQSFQKLEDNPDDISKSIFLNGIQQLFLFFDMFTASHIYKQNRIYDIIILTIIIFIYYLIVSTGKYLEIYEPYEFMKRSEVRQIVAVAIIVYTLLLNGYIVFDLLAFYFFDKEYDKIIDSSIFEDKTITSRQININSLFEKEYLGNQTTIFNDFDALYKKTKIENETTQININNENINNKSNNNNNIII